MPRNWEQARLFTRLEFWSDKFNFFSKFGLSNIFRFVMKEKSICNISCNVIFQIANMSNRCVISPVVV